MSNTLKLSFWSGGGTVTGANFELATDTYHVLVDCGLLQGVPDSGTFNTGAFPYDPASKQVLVITHAHMDHVGRIGKLVKDGFTGVIYSTKTTRDLAELMLADALKIMGFDSRDNGTEPMYTGQDVEKAFSLWKTIPYHTHKDIGGGFSVYLKDAGHILGSAIVEISYGDSKIAFTGDLGNSPSLLLRDTEDVAGVDYLVMESVYGDRNHESKEERRSKLKQAFLDIVKSNGTLVIPAFSLERTQVILYELNEMIENKEIPSIPVFLDSPLAIRITEIYKETSEHYNQDVKDDIKGGDKIFNFPKLKFTPQARDSGIIQKAPNPKIIIAGSGMSAGGRVVNHEARYLPDPKNIILLIGYQAVGTMGRELSEGTKEVTINGQQVKVQAEIRKIGGYSSHKDSDHLVEFVENATRLPSSDAKQMAGRSNKLKKVFLVLGEPKSALFLSQRLRDYVGVETVVPENKDCYELEF